MREGLQVGDEITTIGGVIGRIVSIKDETVLIETGRDRVKIRFLRSAIRSVDVSMAALIAAEKAEAEKAEAEKAALDNVDADTATQAEATEVNDEPKKKAEAKKKKK